MSNIKTKNMQLFCGILTDGANVLKSEIQIAHGDSEESARRFMLSERPHLIKADKEGKFYVFPGYSTTAQEIFAFCEVEYFSTIENVQNAFLLETLEEKVGDAVARQRKRARRAKRKALADLEAKFGVPAAVLSSGVETTETTVAAPTAPKAPRAPKQAAPAVTTFEENDGGRARAPKGMSPEVKAKLAAGKAQAAAARAAAASQEATRIAVAQGAPAPAVAEAPKVSRRGKRGPAIEDGARKRA